MRTIAGGDGVKEPSFKVSSIKKLEVPSGGSLYVGGLPHGLRQRRAVTGIRCFSLTMDSILMWIITTAVLFHRVSLIRTTITRTPKR